MCIRDSGGEDAGLAFEAEDGAVGIRFAGEHAGVVDEVARGEIVSAVGDHVIVADNIERVLAGEHRLVFDDVEEGVQRDEFLGCGIDLGPADVFGAVDDLALQVAGVDDVEVDQAERANAGCGEIKREG